VLGYAAIPAGVVTVVVMMGALRARQDSLREARDRAVADRSRAAASAVEMKARHEAEMEAVRSRNEVRVQRLLDKFKTDRPITLCDAALELARLGARDHVTELKNLMWNEQASNARACAASALVSLGETGDVLATYVAWAGGQNADLRRAALAGFGEIGPDAAELGMPFLNEALDSPYVEVRMVASEAIAKVRPGAAHASASH
jgi:hypothetical protein